MSLAVDFPFSRLDDRVESFEEFDCFFDVFDDEFEDDLVLGRFDKLSTD